MTAANTNISPKKPTHRLFLVLGEGDQAIWKNIGAGWSHADGQGFTLSCEAIPLQGRIVMRTVKPKADSQQGQML